MPLKAPLRTDTTVKFSPIKFQWSWTLLLPSSRFGISLLVKGAAGLLAVMALISTLSSAWAEEDFMSRYIESIGGCKKLNYYDFPFGHQNWTSSDLDLFAKRQLDCIDQIAASRQEDPHETKIYKWQFGLFLAGVKSSLQEDDDKRTQAAIESERILNQEKQAAVANERANDVLARMKSLLASLKTLPATEALRQADALLQESLKLSSGPSDLFDVESQLMYERDTLVNEVKSQNTLTENEAQNQPDWSKTDGPYTDLNMLFADMLGFLSNPLNAADFEAKLRSKGVDQMGAVVVNIVQEAGAWSVQLSADNPVAPNQEQGLFCRVQVSDATSIELLKRVSMGSPVIVISGQVGEYDVSVDPVSPRLRIVFDPCRITGVR